MALLMLYTSLAVVSKQQSLAVDTVVAEYSECAKTKARKSFSIEIFSTSTTSRLNFLPLR